MSILNMVFSVHQISYEYCLPLSLFWHLQNIQRFVIAARQGHVTRTHLPQWHTTFQHASKDFHDVKGRRFPFTSAKSLSNGSISAVPMLSCLSRTYMVMYALKNAQKIRGVKPWDVGGRFWCEADFEKWNYLRGSKLQKIAGLMPLVHLQQAPSTVMLAGSMKVQVELLHQTRARKPQRRLSELLP